MKFTGKVSRAWAVLPVGAVIGIGLVIYFQSSGPSVAPPGSGQGSSRKAGRSEAMPPGGDSKTPATKLERLRESAAAVISRLEREGKFLTPANRAEILSQVGSFEGYSDEELQAMLTQLTGDPADLPDQLLIAAMFAELARRGDGDVSNLVLRALKIGSRPVVFDEMVAIWGRGGHAELSHFTRSLIESNDLGLIKPFVLSAASAVFEEDPKAAYSLIQASKLDPMGWIQQRAEVDPLKALGMVDTPGLERLEQDCILAVAGAELISKDLYKSIELLGRISDPSWSKFLCDDLLQQTKDDPRSTLAVLGQLPPTDALSVVDKLGSKANTLIQAEPDAFVSLVSNVAVTSDNEGLVKRLSSLMMKVDPHRAVEWLGSLPEGPARKEMLSNAFRTWASSPEARGDALLELQDMAGGKIDAIEGFAKAMGAVEIGRGFGSSEIFGDVLENFNDTEKASFIAGWIHGAIPDSPSAARAFVNEYPEQFSLLSESQQKGAAQNIAKHLAQSDLESAIEWVEDLPEGSVRSGAVEGVVDSWFKRDPIKASEWISGMPDSDSRDAAVRILVSKLQRTDPEMAKQWEKTISN